MTRRLVVSALSIYPIKSAGGSRVERAEVTPRGLAWDRRWMVVDLEGRFVSQRQHPRMTLISVSMSDDRLLLSAPDMTALTVSRKATGEVRQVRVWADDCEAISTGSESTAWFSRFLGMDCQLVFMPQSTRRPVNPSFGRAGDIVSFADGFPLLLTTEQSLAELNAHLERPVSMRRFRPNLVVSGGEPFEEDSWRRLRIGDVELRIAKPCGRCQVITVDPDTGETGAEPLRTLSTFRRIGKSVVFGQNAIPDGVGHLNVGDEVAVVASR